jgi:hypothetical protein
LVETFTSTVALAAGAEVKLIPLTFAPLTLTDALGGLKLNPL